MGLGQVILEAMEEEERRVILRSMSNPTMGKCIIKVFMDIMMKMRWSPVLLINELWYCVQNQVEPSQ